MNRVADPLLMLIPEAAMGPVILFLFIAGGLALIVGARRAGKALIITAIALPIMSFLFERLMDILFANLPDALVLPVAWATMVATGLMVVWAIIRLIFGELSPCVRLKGVAYNMYENESPHPSPVS